jgi:uncharacterized membrane protein
VSLRLRRHREIYAMLTSIAVLLAIHIVSVVFWVGGMAFAYTILRPAAGPMEAPVRLAMWARVFARFLPWVGVSVVALLVTGFAMIFMIFGSMGAAPLYVNLMMGLGIIMMLIYLHLTFAPYKRLRRDVERGAFPEAGQALNQIRMLVGINIVIGIITVVIGGTGRYW